MLTIDSKIKDLKKNPKAVEIISEWNPEFSTNPQMKLVQGLTLRKLLSFPQAGADEATIAMLEKKLADANLE